MGLSVPQAMLVIVMGRIMIALFSTIIALTGLKWHIGFTVQNRYSWGLKGSWIPLSQRILLNFIWNAVQCQSIPSSFLSIDTDQVQVGMEVVSLQYA